MKLKVIKGFVCDGKPAKKGATVEVKESIAVGLIATGRAEEVKVKADKKEK